MSATLSTADRLCRVFAAVLGADAARLGDGDSPETLAAWDSVAHIQLVIAVEAEFGIELSPDAIGDLTTVGAFREQIEGLLP